MTAPLWVRDLAGVSALAETLCEAKAVALDTESDSLHHYVEKVCLLQFADDRGRAWLVDPLAVKDLSPLAGLFKDPGITKVLHGADYDVTTLKRDFGFTFAALFDTMIAARVLGLPELGLQSVALAELGVSLSKDSQKDDWSRRPLTAKQEAYAAADVEHLIALRERLESKLEVLGRASWVREECDAVADLPAARKGRDPEAFLKVKGALRLSPDDLRILAGLHAWREALAAAADVPTFKIVGNETLLALATGRPQTQEALGKIRGLPPRLREKGLLEALSRAAAEPPIHVPKKARDMPSDAERTRVDALRTWRAEEGKERALDVSVILPQRLIDRIAKENPKSTEELERVEGLRRWRSREFGAAILQKLKAAPTT